MINMTAPVETRQKLGSLVGNQLCITGTLARGKHNGTLGKICLRRLNVTLGGDASEEEIPTAPLPTGFRELDVPDAVISSHRPGDLVPVSEIFSPEQLANFPPNTCFQFNYSGSPALARQDRRRFTLGVLKKEAGFVRIVPKPKERDGRTVHPVNVRQALAFALLMDPAIDIVTLYGKAGTGKTLLALLAGLNLIGKIPKDFGMPMPVLTNETGISDLSKIIVCRDVSGVGRAKLGFLPGDLDEKMQPWGEAVTDALDAFPGTYGADKLLHDGWITVCPVTHLRGRTLRAFIIADDAQNLSSGDDENVVKTLVSRAGEGSKCVFTGDPDQVDTPGLSKDENGIVHVLRRTIKAAGGFENAACMELQKGERSKLADFAAMYL